MCKAYSTELAIAQEKHCDKPLQISVAKQSLLEEDTVPESFALDYSCVITLNDVSKEGGFVIKQHVGPAGQCSPVVVLSQTGLDQMLASPHCACPFCYKRLEKDDFQKVPPKEEFVIPASYTALEKTFAPSSHQPRSFERNGGGNANNNNINYRGGAVRNANGKTGTLVIMKGTVGSGKTTWSGRISETVTNRGGSCYVEGTDKYVSQGIPFQTAINTIKTNLLGITNDTNDDIVVMIDTCGERGGKEIFGVNFEGWKQVDVYPNLDKKNLKGYFSWTLRNVLMRGPTNNDGKFNLTPASAGVHTCIEVHKKKCDALFKKQFKGHNFAGATVQSLQDEAEKYEKESLPNIKFPDNI